MAATTKPARPVNEPTTTEDPALGDEVEAAADPEALAEPDMEPVADMELDIDMDPVAEAADSEAPEAEPEAELATS